MNGYNGKFLRVNLSTKKIEEEIIPKSYYEYIGGSGFGTKILCDEVLPRCDPLGLENKLILATGPMTGTCWPSSGRLAAISKSPLTNGYGDSNCGGFFAPELKKAGIDYLVIEGKSDVPVYLSINNGNYELKDATRLWGMKTTDTIDAIKKIEGDSQIATIGPAGENLVRYACIMVGDRALARSGLGAVMGSKNLKAIAVKGEDRFNVADPIRLLYESTKSFFKIKNNKFTKNLSKYGTPLLLKAMSKIGRLPSYNFKTGSFERIEDVSGEKLHELNDGKVKSCYRCPIGCSRQVSVKRGEFKGTKVNKIEYESIDALGPKCGNSNLASIIKASKLCDELGLDTTSAGGAISFAMECCENGLIKDKNLVWGNYMTIINLLSDIAYRRGLGDILADGVKIASEQIDGSEKYAMHVNGMEMPAQDPRGQKSMGLSHVTSSRGADHLKGFPTLDEIGNLNVAAKIYGKDIAKKVVDRLSTEYKPLIVKDGEESSAVIDSLGICKFGTRFPQALYMSDLAKGLSYITGNKYTAEDLRLVGERIVTLQRLYNLKAGVGNGTLPERFLEKSPITGEIVEIDKMVNEYYSLRDWDRNGIPTEATLEKLGISY